MYQPIEAIPIESLDYPKQLKATFNPPKVLYVKGNKELLYKPSVAIVGTRDCSKAGAFIAQRIAKFLSEQGYTIVSGLALGIDAAAHEGGIKSTVAVLAHGLHEAHPRSNAHLAQRILDEGGAWISEHSENTAPKRQFFVPRNRIQVGLTTSSIIVESAEKGGTMTHASFATKERHPLFAILPQEPSNKLGLNTAGCQKLVSDQNAIAIRSKQDYTKLLDVLSRCH